MQRMRQSAEAVRVESGTVDILQHADAVGFARLEGNFEVVVEQDLVISRVVRAVLSSVDEERV